jgi:hypothetical protein
MIPVSTAENNFDEKTFFVSTFLDKYKCMRFELDSYSLSTKTELEFYSKFLE